MLEHKLAWGSVRMFADRVGIRNHKAESGVG